MPDIAQKACGERRFAAPHPPATWIALCDATTHGPIAPQAPYRPEVAMGGLTRPMDEDCPTLTILTATIDRGARTVLACLQGGAGSIDWYDTATLAREGIMDVVSGGWVGLVHTANPGVAGLNWQNYHRMTRPTIRFGAVCAVAGDPAGSTGRARA